jgi:hypothetical protein
LDGPNLEFLIPEAFEIVYGEVRAIQEWKQRIILRRKFSVRHKSHSIVRNGGEIKEILIELERIAVFEEARVKFWEVEGVPLMLEVVHAKRGRSRCRNSVEFHQIAEGVLSCRSEVLLIVCFKQDLRLRGGSGV